jgi:hypothetical protein
MDLKTKLTDHMSNELFIFINSEDYKNSSPESQKESLKLIFDNLYSGLEEYSENFMDNLLQGGSDESYREYLDKDRRNWLSALLFIIILSFSSYTLNTIFNILPRFSFFEAFGFILLGINIYSISSSYISRN